MCKVPDTTTSTAAKRVGDTAVVKAEEAMPLASPTTASGLPMTLTVLLLCYYCATTVLLLCYCCKESGPCTHVKAPLCHTVNDHHMLSQHGGSASNHAS